MTAGRRDEVAQRSPSRALGDFPRRSVSQGCLWYRNHGPLGPWFYASGATGRFNLDSPRGTLYLADDPVAAIKEFVGPEMARNQYPIPSSVVADRYVSTLELQETVSAAKLTDPRADQWGVVPGELPAMSPYDLPREWAKAFYDAGFDGIWTTLRYSSPDRRGLAVFGDAGARSQWPQGTRETARKVLEDAHYQVVDPPSTTGLAWTSAL